VRSYPQYEKCFWLFLLSSSLSVLGVPDLAWYVSLVYIRFLEEHVEAPLVLGERMPCHLVDKALQPGSPVLDEVLLKDAIVPTEWQLSLEGFARQRWHNNFAVSLELVPQPLEV